MRLPLIYAVLLCICTSALFGQDTVKSKPFVLGEVLELQSAKLSEKRILNIYLPDGYNKTDTVRYPVIYLLDGSAKEDFIHIAGLVQFASFPWVKIMPKAILVGIENVDRQRDFTYPTTIAKDKKDVPTSGGSAKFIAFLESELQPFISKRYKTNSSKTLIGESLGGLLATEILFKKPLLFNHYMIISPSLWWDNESLLKTEAVFFKPKFKSKLSVFIAVGKEGNIMERDADRLRALLQINKNIGVNYEYFSAENHGTILHLAAYKGFQMLYK